MKFILAAILSICFVQSAGATDVPPTRYTFRGAVVTAEGKMVPKFTVVVRPKADRPELVPRIQFTNGLFKVEGLSQERYQFEIRAEAFVNVRVDVQFEPESDHQEFRVVVLHKLRNEMTPRSREPVYTVSLTDLERKVPSDAQSFYKHGVELYREGKTDEALAAYGQAIRSYPNYVEALSDVATIYLLMNRPDAALTMLKRAQQIDGHNSVVRINIAIAHMNRGDYRESVKTLQNLIVEDYQDSVALYYLAKAYLLDKKFKEAHTAIQAAITNDPQMIDAWVLQLNLALEQDNHPLACETLHELRRRLDNNAFSEFAEQQTVMLND